MASVDRDQNKLNRLSHSVLRGTPLSRSCRRRFGPLGTQSRRSRFVPERTEEEDQNIRELRGKTWKLFRLTPLYNFQNKKSDFQHYSRTLSSYIAAEAKKGTFIDNSIPDDALISQFSGLDVGICDPKALLIELKGKARNGNVQVISQAVLFSTDLEINPLKPSQQDKFVYYSCMLIRGSVVHSETVQNWLEMQFDCRVLPMTFTSFELGFMTAMLTGLDDEDKAVELVYNVPKEVEGLSTITYSTRTEDCKRLWKLIRSSDTNGFTYEEASRFMAGLEGHFYGCFNIKLSALLLVSTQTAAAFVGKQGQIKFITKSVENIRKVLRHLTDLALEQLKTMRILNATSE